MSLTNSSSGNEETKSQVEPDHYYNIIYDTKERFCSLLAPDTRGAFVKTK